MGQSIFSPQLPILIYPSPSPPKGPARRRIRRVLHEEIRQDIWGRDVRTLDGGMGTRRGGPLVGRVGV